MAFYLVPCILLLSTWVCAQQEEQKTKNELSGGMVINKRPYLGASIMYKRLGTINFRIRLDGEKITEKYNHRDDYIFIRMGADKIWLIGSWRLGAGSDLFANWTEELKDTAKVHNHQAGLMPFFNIHRILSPVVSIGLEGGPKLGYYLRTSDSRKGWHFQGFQGVVLIISYRL